MRKRFLAAALAALMLIPAISIQADIKGSYSVQEVVGPEKVRIAFHGLPIIVRLAHVQARPEAQALLKELVNGQSVSIRYATELGLDESGIPFVNMAVGPALKRQIVNIELVTAGVADYDYSRARSAAYDEQLTAAVDQAKTAKLGMWAADAAPPAPKPAALPAPEKPAAPEPIPVETKSIVAEINGIAYHLTTCSHARRLSKRNIIRYANAGAAERGGKKPCSRCHKDRARKAREKANDGQTGKRTWPAPLIGLKSNPKYFYTPVAPQLKKVKADDMIGFDTVKAAKASGRKPDPISMRLTALPGYPLELPEAGECIGRALPFFRPCRRDASDPSGLCEWCAKGE